MTNKVATIVIFRDNGSRTEVLTVKRGFAEEADKWCLPGGHIREYECPEEGARRELKEETGLDIQKLIRINKYYSLHAPEDTIYASIVEDKFIISGTDAFDAKWVDIGNQEFLQSLAFEHAKFVMEAYTKLYGRELAIVKLNECISSFGKRIILENKTKGKLVVFCGIDGSAKSTNLKILHKWLKDNDYKVATTKWNSSDYLSEVIKAGKEKKILTPLLYSLLHAADLLCRYDTEILPALSEGKIVLADRYIYTSMVRDGVRGIDRKIIELIYKDLVRPDIIIHCVVPVEVAISRIMDDKGLSYYGSGMDIKLDEDMKNSAVKYERLMDKLYKEILPKEKGYHLINCEKPVDEVAIDVRNVIRKFLKINENAPEYIACLID